MNFTIVDSQSAYRKMLAAPDAAAREAVFCEELVKPFAGLVQCMGGSDPLAMFRQWNMSPEQFAGEQGQQMTHNLDALVAAEAWTKATQALTDGAAAFTAFEDRILPCDVTFGLLLCDMRNVPLQRGYSGFGAIPGWIMTVYDTPTDYNLYRIKACTVHELHHNILSRVFPHNMMTFTVGEYMIMEGLAESFAAELYGNDTTGFWVSEFDETQLEKTRQIIRAALKVSGFNEVRGYIFGDEMAGFSGIVKAGVPAFAGYALGYRTVQAYLQRTGKSVAEATFVNAWQIIEESEFFAE